jgi:hypothetical protein
MLIANLENLYICYFEVVVVLHLRLNAASSIILITTFPPAKTCLASKHQGCRPRNQPIMKRPLLLRVGETFESDELHCANLNFTMRGIRSSPVVAIEGLGCPIPCNACIITLALFLVCLFDVR